jgi:hypothetical protein
VTALADCYVVDVSSSKRLSTFRHLQEAEQLGLSQM